MKPTYPVRQYSHARETGDNDGELYLLTKADGVIRKVVGAREATAPAPAAVAPTPGPGQNVGSQPAATIKNPVAPTPESIADGKRSYDANCAACHGNLAQGAVKAGMTISIIEGQKGRQPPDLTDGQWAHGSTDGEVFTVIKRGLPPTMMAGYDGRLPDAEIWSIVNYLRTLRTGKQRRIVRAAVAGRDLDDGGGWLRVGVLVADPAGSDDNTGQTLPQALDQHDIRHPRHARDRDLLAIW